MCLLLISYKVYPNYKIIIAANRDEFYDRPAEAANYWKENPSILAGKDLKAGGTWLGITKEGRFAAITNYRNMKINNENAPSRGKLIIDFLSNKTSIEDYSNKLKESSRRYNGYNLVFGDKENLFYFSNATEKLIKLTPGIYGLSNHLLDTPWPKVEKSKNSFKEKINNKDVGINDLFDILSDKTAPPDEFLPNTELNIEIERAVSPIFVETPFYGTRSSTVILWDNNDKIIFVEKFLNPSNKKWTTNSFRFKII